MTSRLKRHSAMYPPEVCVPHCLPPASVTMLPLLATVTCCMCMRMCMCLRMRMCMCVCVCVCQCVCAFGNCDARAVITLLAQTLFSLISCIAIAVALVAGLTCPLGASCVQSPFSTDIRRRVCQPHPETQPPLKLWAIQFIIDENWRSMCALDANGCRKYITSSDGSAYGNSNGLVITVS